MDVAPSLLPSRTSRCARRFRVSTCEAVTSERNILGKQLIRRNEELSLIYEKIKIQERDREGTHPRKNSHVFEWGLASRVRTREFSHGCGSKPMGSHFGVGASPILVIFSGDWVRDFDP